MTPEEKAREIHLSMCYEIASELLEVTQEELPIYILHAKNCALNAIDIIIKELTEEISPSVHGFRHQYWKQVKDELEKL